MDAPLQMIDFASKNHAPRTRPVDMLVLHYTGMKSAAEALERLRDETPGRRVSAHYVVDEDGSVYAMVPEDREAWHAGKSAWRGEEGVNARSVGIEIVNPGHEFGYRPFPDAQMRSVAALSRQVIEKNEIPAWNVVGHSDIAPGRKSDPGELFPWKWLAEQGIGLWPEAQGPQGEAKPGLAGWLRAFFGRKAARPALHFGGSGPRVAEMQRKLAAYGYSVPCSGMFCGDTKEVAIAFQRHFRPERLDGVWDAACAARLEGLLARAPAATLESPEGRTAADL